MPTSLSTRILFDFHREKLALEWLAGHSGGERPINVCKQPPATNFAAQGCASALGAGCAGAASASPSLGAPSKTPENRALIGRLNLIYPNLIQVLGISELAYLAGLGKNSHEDALRQLFESKPAVVIIADKQHASPVLATELIHYAERSGTPLLASLLSSDAIINHLHYYLANLLADKVVLHGVFMEVLGIGVLLTGDSGVGKSELALELVSRGNRLIADDSPEFSCIAPDTLNGTCPALLRDFLEVRGLGVLNIRAMFGDSAIKNNKYLRLIIHLKQMSDEEVRNMDRLQGNHSTCRILEVNVPQTALPVAPGRNLAVLVEGAVRNHILSFSGYSAASDFAERQRQHMVQASDETAHS